MANADNAIILRIAMSELDEIERTGILDVDAARAPLFRPAVTSAFIHLKDGMRALADMGRRITETGEDIYCRKEGGDLTDLIADARNAACHLTTAIQDIGPSIFRWNTSRGPDGGAFIQGVALGCPYADDLAIYIGPLRVYMRRNLLRAIQLTRSGAGALGFS